MTVNLGMDADAPWPIWIAGPMGIAAVALRPGDGLVYRGCDCFHWREPFPGRYLAQLFLHHVDRDGPNAQWKFDKRPALAGAAAVSLSGCTPGIGDVDDLHMRGRHAVQRR